MREAVIEHNGSYYRDKQESLDYVDELAKSATPIHGLEVVRFTKEGYKTSMYKTVWYDNQDGVYEKARSFIKGQMVGLWNYVEFK